MGHDLLLGPKLRVVAHVLPLAATATAEQRTAGVASIRSWLEQPDQLTAAEGSALLHQLHQHRVARGAQRHEHHSPVVQTAHGVAAKGQRVEVDGEPVCGPTDQGKLWADRPRASSKSNMP